MFIVDYFDVVFYNMKHPKSFSEVKTSFALALLVLVMSGRPQPLHSMP